VGAYAHLFDDSPSPQKSERRSPYATFFDGSDADAAAHAEDERRAHDQAWRDEITRVEKERLKAAAEKEARDRQRAEDDAIRKVPPVAGRGTGFSFEKQAAVEHTLQTPARAVRESLEQRTDLPSRVGATLAGMIEHPEKTAVTMAVAPVVAAKTGAEFMGQTAAELTLRDEERARALADPERISEADAALSGLQLAVLGTAGPTRDVIGRLLARGVGSRLAGVAATSAVGAEIGTVYAPEDPSVGAVLGAFAGGLANEISPYRALARRPVAGEGPTPEWRPNRLLPRAGEPPAGKATASYAGERPVEPEPFTRETVEETLAKHADTVRSATPAPLEEAAGLAAKTPAEQVAKMVRTVERQQPEPQPGAEVVQPKTAPVPDGRAPLPTGLTFPASLVVNPESVYAGDADQPADLYAGGAFQALQHAQLGVQLEAALRTPGLKPKQADAMRQQQVRSAEALASTLDEVQQAFGLEAAQHMAKEVQRAVFLENKVKEQLAAGQRRQAELEATPAEAPDLMPAMERQPNPPAVPKRGPTPQVEALPGMTPMGVQPGDKGRVVPTRGPNGEVVYKPEAIPAERPVDNSGYLVPQVGDQVSTTIYGTRDAGDTQLQGIVAPGKRKGLVVQIVENGQNTGRTMPVETHGWKVAGDPRVAQDEIEAKAQRDADAEYVQQVLAHHDVPGMLKYSRGRPDEQEVLDELYDRLEDAQRGPGDDPEETDMTRYYRGPDVGEPLKEAQQPIAVRLAELGETGHRTMVEPVLNDEVVNTQATQAMAIDRLSPEALSRARRNGLSDEQIRVAINSAFGGSWGSHSGPGAPSSEYHAGVNPTLKIESSGESRTLKGKQLIKKFRELTEIPTPEDAAQLSEGARAAGEKAPIAPATETPIVKQEAAHGAGGAGPVREPLSELPSGAAPEGAEGVAGERPVERAAPSGGSGSRGRVRTDVQAGNGEPDGGRDVSGPRGGHPEGGDVSRLGSDAEHRPGEPGGVDYPAPEAAGNYRLTDADAIGTGSATARIQGNFRAIEVLKALIAEGRTATPAEQAVLAKYVGWGDSRLAKIFDEFSDSRNALAKEREALRALVSPAEYDAMRASTLNAHFTSPDVIRFVWQALDRMGLSPTAKALEPSAGVGHFVGFGPPGVHFSAVELDTITGGILKALYPEAAVQVQGFEKFQRPDNTFDVVVGNVPFGKFQLSEKRYDALKLSIHNHFLVKSLDLARPGGVVALITSRYTMDAVEQNVRVELAKRGDLVAAIRLPNSAFEKNAGTVVVTDILFFRKRAPEAERGGMGFLSSDWKTLGGGQRAQINEYFIAHPDMVLGEHALTGTMYGPEQYTVEPKGKDLDYALRQTLEQLPRGVFSDRPRTGAAPPAAFDVDALTEAPGFARVKEYGYYDAGKDGIVQKVKGVAIAPNPVIPKSAIPRVKRLMGLRDALVDLRKAEAQGQPDEITEPLRAELNTRYEAFVREHGPVALEKHSTQVRTKKDGSTYEIVTIRRPNLTYFNDDPDSNAVAALETYQHSNLPDVPSTVRKADILSRRTIRPATIVPVASSPGEALYQSLNQFARIDLEWMAGLLGEDAAAVRTALESSNLIFEDPTNGALQVRDVYLAGNVREKLRAVEAVLSERPELQRNAEALRAVIPKDIPAAEINVTLAAAWIPTDVVAEFATTALGFDAHVRHNIREGAWSVEPERSWDRHSAVGNTVTYGTERVDGLDILREALAQKKVQVFDTFRDAAGNDKAVLNIEETLKAQEKQQKLEDEYQRWLWSDAGRAKSLAREYNDKFNAINNLEVDGSHLELPGTASHMRGKPFALRPHQKNTIYRGLLHGNQMIAKVVGSGKTFDMIALGMESKRLGFAQKPMYTVLNSMLGQFAREFIELYPNANVLVATEADFAKKNRRKFIARMSQNDWDAVVITHSSFGKIPMSPEFQQRMLSEEMIALEDEIREAKRDKSERSIVKVLEASKIKLQERLRRLSEMKKDADFITFEETGIDMLFVDEAQYFKNLMTRSRTRGLGAEGSGMAFDLYWKSKFLDEINPGRGLTMATGTPISNSLVEMFTLQRYLAPKQLSDRGLQALDSWFSVFGKMVTAAELDPSGAGYRLKERPAAFNNIPELAQMFREFADVKGNEDVFPDVPGQKNAYGLERSPLPKVLGGHPENVVVQPTVAQLAYTQHLIHLGEKVKGKRPEKGQENILTIFTKGKTAATDLRLMSGAAPEGSAMLDAMLERALRHYHESTPDRGTQLIFVDVGTPTMGRKAAAATAGPTDEEVLETEQAGAVEAPVEEAQEVEATSFQLYDAIRAQLEVNGVPASEIAYIHDAKNSTQKGRLQAKVNAGEVRFLIGSTAKMGAGVNVQRLVVAAHELDVPANMRPADIEQREGRVIRQGNLLWDTGKIDGVAIYRYSTEHTMAANLWDMQERKARMITSMMKGKTGGLRTIDDVDGQVRDFETMKALTSGNPMVMERVTLEKEVAMLEAARRGHLEAQGSSLEKARTLEYTTLPARLAQAEDAATDMDAANAIDTAGDKFAIDILKRHYTDRKDAGLALVGAIKTQVIPRQGTYGAAEWVGIGKLGSFTLIARLEAGTLKVGIQGKGYYQSEAELSADGFGMIRSIESLPKKVEAVHNWAIKEARALKAQVAALHESSGKPWEREEELKAKQERLALVKSQTETTAKTRMESLAPELSAEWWRMARDGVFPYVEVPIDVPPEGAPDGTANGGPTPGSLLTPELNFLGLGTVYRVLFEPRGVKPIRPIVSSANPEVEAAWMKNRGIPPGERAKLHEHLLELYQSFKRHFPYLDQRASLELAASADILRRIEAAPAWAKLAAVERVRYVVQGLSVEQVDLMNRVLVARDQLRNLEEGRSFSELGHTNRAELEADLARFERAAHADAKVWNALDRRAAFAKQLTTRLVQLEILPESVLGDDRYYHRQVMEYLVAKDAVYAGVSARDLHTKRKGFQIRRQEESGAFNTLYQEAEFEWVAHAYSQIATAEAQAELKQLNDVKGDLTRQAKSQNDAALVQRTLEVWNRAADGDPAAAMQLAAWNVQTPIDAADPTLQFRKRLARHFTSIYKILTAPNSPVNWSGWASLQKALTEQWIDHSALPASVRREQPFTFSHPDFLPFLSEQIAMHGPAELDARGVYAAMAARTKFVSDVLGEAEVSWDDLIPDGKVIWQPREGSVFFKAGTIAEELVNRVLAGEAVTLTPDEIRTARVEGGRREEWVIDAGLARTLDELEPQRHDAVLEGIWRNAIGAWKQWMLLSPMRAAKYNINNQFGDSDIVFAFEPRIFGEAPAAIRDLHAFLRGTASPEIVDELLEATRLRVLGSGLSIAEIPDLAKTAAFEGISAYAPSVLEDALLKYWGTVRAYTNFRENVLRLAAYRWLQKEAIAGRQHYAASNAFEVDALSGNARQARVATDLLIDYGNISAAGTWLRSRLMPFYSWLEGNSPRYFRLLKNAALEPNASQQRARTTATAGFKIGMTLAQLLLRMNVMYALVYLYNRLLHPDEVEALRRSGKANHLILGKRDDGSIMSLRIEGAFADMLKWVGLEDWPEDVKDLVQGSATWANKAVEAAQAPVNRVVQSWEPVSKSLFELATGRTTYPSVFRPGGGLFEFDARPMRDRAEAASRIVALDWLYREITGRPRRPGSGLANSVLSLMTYRTDPGEASYFYTRQLISKWQAATGQPFGGGEPSDRSNALAYFKQAARWGDDEAANRWLAKYYALGGKPSGVAQSLKLSAPMGGLSPLRRHQFLKSLTPIEREAVQESERWWKVQDGERDKIRKALHAGARPLPRRATSPSRPLL